MKFKDALPVVGVSLLIGFAAASSPKVESQVGNEFKHLHHHAQILSLAVNKLGNELGKDIVVVDRNEVIIADTIEYEVGTKFPHDKAEEVGMVLKDGQTRSFLEVSKAYPDGVQLKTEAITNEKGDILGALIWED